jgi:hypothetical protein
MKSLASAGQEITATGAESLKTSAGGILEAVKDTSLRALHVLVCQDHNWPEIRPRVRRERSSWQPGIKAIRGVVNSTGWRAQRELQLVGERSPRLTEFRHRQTGIQAGFAQLLNDPVRSLGKELR